MKRIKKGECLEDQPRLHGQWNFAYDLGESGIEKGWFSARPESCIESVNIVPDLDNCRFVITQKIANCRYGIDFQVILFSEEGKELASKKQFASNSSPLILTLSNPEVWCPDN